MKGLARLTEGLCPFMVFNPRCPDGLCVLCIQRLDLVWLVRFSLRTSVCGVRLYVWGM
jgi:hypothetical protein